MTHTAPPAAEKRLGSGRLWMFASAVLPTALLAIPLSAYLPPLYATQVGLSLTTIGLIFMGARIFDVVIDPFMGMLTDNTRSRFGRRRPWIVLSAPLLMLSGWALFFPPETATALWLIAALFAVTLANTILSITHIAWSADVAVGYDDRSRVQGILLMATIGGTLAAMLLPALLEGGAADPIALRAHIIGWLIIGTTPLVIAAAAWAGRDKPVAATAGEVRIRENPFHVVVNAIRRQPFLGRLLAADLLQGLAGGVLGGMSIFYAAAKGISERTSLLILCFYLSGVIFVPLWIRLSRKFGKARTIGWSSILSIGLILIVAFTPPGRVDLACAAFAAFGSTMGVWIFLMKSIVSDLVHDEEVETGRPRAGTMFALFILTQKLGAALAIGVTYVVLDRWGITGAGTMSAEAAPGVVALMTAPVILGHLVMAVVTLTWKGDKRGTPAMA